MKGGVIMIYVLLDQSYADDYLMISEISINIKDQNETERIEKLVESNNIIGSLVDADNDLKNRIARLLNVDASIIDFDTNDIDLY